ncbi:N-acetylmuramoyl-L-alanine amidase [Candidatus Phycosocius spiralis]|uniref:N-acetylmuramoyl-L-alanine amidase n=1 Tax=Candidatus Phycosocius spiralis TaxID=2815099 RepID=A0ABQ4PSH8_9PROT|nr:N-acetylmuramoyl-L-alanine amidase [Candidatus Phycosocius spiralis]GIU65931.1 N-acetyl-anhydromuramyl-L-alanine amidase [Candidatus Phycosocius spiralis]
MLARSIASPKPLQSRIKTLTPLTILQSPSPNFDERTRPIRLIVLHYTGMQSEQSALRILTDPAPTRSAYQDDLPRTPQNTESIPESMSRVSSHYLALQDGTIHQLVDESKRAWHAGKGFWDGETDVNSASIGIEIANGGHDFGLPEFAESQIVAVMQLVKHILQRHGLDKHHVIGHSDVAPARKPDPGEKFPWKRFAEAGLSIWPAPALEDGDQRPLFDEADQMDHGIAAVQTGLDTIGYGIPVNGRLDAHTRAVLTAFQRRFRPNKVDGMIDIETKSLVGRVASILRP